MPWSERWRGRRRWLIYGVRVSRRLRRWQQDYNFGDVLLKDATEIELRIDLPRVSPRRQKLATVPLLLPVYSHHFNNFVFVVRLSIALNQKQHGRSSPWWLRQTVIVIIIVRRVGNSRLSLFFFFPISFFNQDARVVVTIYNPFSVLFCFHHSSVPVNIGNSDKIKIHVRICRVWPFTAFRHPSMHLSLGSQKIKGAA